MTYDSKTGIYKSPYPDLELVNQNLWEFLEPKFEEYQDQIVTICAKTLKQLTYQELKEQCLKWAGYLLKEKSKKEINVVAIYSPQAFEFPTFVLGCVAAGITYTSIVPVFTPAEVANQLQDSGANILVVDSSLVENARKGIELTGKDINLIINGKCDSNPSTLNFQDIIEGEEFADTKPVYCDPSSIVNLLYTSGTTGKPKGVAASHAAYTNMLNVIFEREPGTCGVTLSSMPMFHVGGLLAIVLNGITRGFTIVIDKYQADDDLIRDAIKFKVTEMYVITTMMRHMAQSPIATKELFDTVEVIKTGGSVNSPEDINKIMEKSSGRTKVQQGYGMTEIGIACQTPVEELLADSIGKLQPNVEAKVIDVNSGASLGPGNVGELCIRSPYTFSYYINRPTATANTKDKDGWVHTGDLVKIEENGFVYFISRLKELIKVYVQQVSPTEVEETLMMHPSIKDAAVIGIPDEEAGELPKGFLVLHEGKEVEKEEIHEFLKEKLAPYKQLKGGIQFVKELERNHLGKLVRGEIRKMHEE